MSTQILQIENTNVTDFEKRILLGVTATLENFAKSLQNPNNDILLNRSQTAELLGVSLVTLDSWTKKNILPGFRIGNKIRYRKSQVLESLQQMNKFSS